MQRIAVTKTCGVKPRAVVINHTRAEGDLIFPVAVHIADGQAVRALSAIREICGVAVIAVERPTQRERTIPPIPRREISARVVAATKYRAWSQPIAVSHAREEAINAVAVVVAPDCVHARCAGIVVVVVLIALRIKCCRGEFDAGLTVENGKKFRPVQNVTIRHTAGMIEAIIIRVVECWMSAVSVLPFCNAANIVAAGVKRAGRGATHQLRFTITIIVEHHEIHVVRAGTDVRAKINTPEPCAVQFVTIKERVACETALRIVMRIGGIPFENDFVFTVTIHVRCAAIIGSHRVRHTIERHAVGRRRERDGDVLLDGRVGRHRIGNTVSLSHAVEDRLNEPRMRGSLRGIGI